MDIADVADIYPLAPIQEGLLFHALEHKGGSAYLEHAGVTYRGVLDAAAFRAAWQHVVDRHPALRTSFHWERLDHPRQVVHKRAVLPFAEHDWQHLSEPEQRDGLDRLVREDLAVGFDLTEPPLLRCRLVRLGAQQYRFLLTAHHLIVDGWSTGILLSEVAAAYEALRDGRRPEQGAGPAFRDFVAWTLGQDKRAAEAFWRRELEGLAGPPRLRTPAFPGQRPQDPSSARREHRFVLDAERTRALREAAKARRLTLGTLVQAACGLLLSRHAGRSDVVFGAISAGRPAQIPGIEAMVGNFASTVPLRLDVDPRRPAGAWLAEVQDRAAEARRYGHLSLTGIHGCSRVPRGTPLFDVVQVLENITDDQQGMWGRLPALSAEEVEYAGEINYPLALVAIPDAALELRAAHDPALVPAELAERLPEQLAALLTGLAEDFDREIGAIPMTGAAERDRIAAWSKPSPYTPPPSLYAAIARHAEAHPESAALAHRGEQIGYRQLVARAECIAGRLLSAGAAAELPVGILLRDPVEQVAAILAVLRTGAAFVLLDPDASGDPAWGAAQPELILARSSAAPAYGAAQVVDLDEPATDPGAPGPVAQPPPTALACIVPEPDPGGGTVGVMVEYAALDELAVRQREVFAIRPGDSVLRAAAVDSSRAVFEIVLALASGARLDLSAADHTAPPGTWRVTAETECATRWESGDGRSVLVRGSAATGFLALAGDPAAPDRLRPVGSTAAHVLDASGLPQPAAVAGELYLGGPCIARGLAELPLPSAQRFPVVTLPNGRRERLCRTGALARWTEDGAVQFAHAPDDAPQHEGPAPASAPPAGPSASSAHVEPRTELERIVAEAWQEVLDVPRVGVTDDFFDLGGDSLAAVRVIARLQRELDRDIDLSDLLEGLTVERLAAVLGADPDTERPFHVALQEHGERPPVFCVHPSGGNTLVYQALADRLGPDQPFYVLEPPDPAAFRGLEDLAEQLARTVRTVAPGRPYRLCGLSAGGLGALELARVLDQAGERVELVALFDTTVPRLLPPGAARGLTTRRTLRFARAIELLFRCPPLAVSADDLAGLAEEEQLDLLFARAAHEGVFGVDGVADTVRKMGETFRYTQHFARSYQPKPYSGPVYLYRASEQVPEPIRDPEFDRPDPDGGWSPFLERLSVVAIPGDHLTALTAPAVDTIADHLRGVLETARREEAVSAT